MLDLLATNAYQNDNNRSNPPRLVVRLMTIESVALHFDKSATLNHEAFY